jgi:hypothetical protein
MYCKFCGKEVDERAELCVHCGRRLRSSLSMWFENSELTQLRPQKTPKSPGLAGFLGFVLGWIPFIGPFGYLYLGQWNWFWLTLVIYIVAFPLTATIAYVIFPFIFAFHQYQMARDLNEMLAGGNESADTGAPHKGGGPTGDV